MSLIDTATEKATEYANNLTGGLLDKATDLQNNLLSFGDKIDVNKIEGMLEGNFKNLTGNAMEMLSKADIGKDMLEQFKNKPTAILDSVMTSVDEKIANIKNTQQLLSNLSGNLPVNFGEMMQNANFKDVLSQAGINSDMLDKVDLNNVKNLDDLKGQLESVLPNDVMSKVENLGGMENLLNKATGGMEGLIKNFSLDKIKDVAMSEIAGKVPANIVSRFMTR